MAVVHKTDFAGPINAEAFKTPMGHKNAEHVARQFYRIKHYQAVAADLAAAHGDIMEGPGEIREVRVAAWGAQAGAGESMTVNVLKNGVTILDAVITIDSSTPVDGVLKGVLDSASAARFVAGDKITITRDYTAGGTPTPMTDTVVFVECQYD